ncbi:MAG: FkbM family methyltransferase [Bacteroidales bacterium]
MIKKLVKNILHRFGKDIVPYDEYEKKLEPVKFNWLKSFNINTIIDIGASDGGYAKKIRAIFPDARIFSFEVINDSYIKLKERFKDDSKFQAFNICLSNYNGHCDFFVNEYKGSSSMLNMSRLHKEAYLFTQKYQPIQVECKTLDSFIEQNKVEVEENILLKLDVQGAEWIVLEGAHDILKRVKVIFMEVSFNTLYENSVLFSDTVIKMNQLGFNVIGIENISQSLIDGTFLQADVYLVRNN